MKEESLTYKIHIICKEVIKLHESRVFKVENMRVYCDKNSPILKLKNEKCLKFMTFTSFEDY